MNGSDANIGICIIMPVFNGAGFVLEQLNSIAGQECENWVLLSRDDESSDDSFEIFRESAKSELRFHALTDGNGRLGAVRSFGCLLQEAMNTPARYIACSDQDDVWRADKLTRQLALMQELEQQHPGEPILVHSDLEVVDARLRPLAPSLMGYQGIRHEEHDPLKVLLAQNFVTGCTVLVNRPLLELALPIPDEALMHDWWLALIAAASGHIGYVDEPLVKYRQHRGNTVGAKSVGRVLGSNWRKFWATGMANFKKSVAQAGALQSRIRQFDSASPCLETIAAYASLLEQRPLARLRTLSQHGIHAQSWHRNLLLLLRALLARVAI